MYRGIKYGALISASLAVALTLLACGGGNTGDIPNSAGGDGRGDATNTLRYQNRSVK